MVLKNSFVSIFFFIVFFQMNCSSFKMARKQWTPSYKVNSLDFVRVLLGKEKNKVTIHSDGLIKVFDVNHILIKKTIQSISLDVQRLRARITLVSDAPLVYNNRSYRGLIEIVPGNSSRSSYIVNMLPIREYLYSVVPSEVPNHWPMDSLKAQSIAARTYLIYHLSNNYNLNRPYDIEANTNFQVYFGLDKENPRTSAAVDSTKNLILVYDQKPIQAFFHSNSGGVTESSRNLWGLNLPYLQLVRSNFCKLGKNYLWKKTMSQSYVDRKLAYLKIGSIKDIVVLGRTPSGRVDLLEIYGKKRIMRMDGAEFRKIMGTTLVKSLRFGIQKDINGFFVKGLGYGHGVGLSQWGSYGMAKNNYSYVEILKHYYKGVELATISKLKGI